jgi:hypothetical protein
MFERTVHTSSSCHSASRLSLKSQVSMFKHIYPKTKINAARIWGTVAFSILATAPAMALPLQVGNYRIGSKYIQIASKGDRVCYQGKSATRAVTASVAPHSLSDFYVVNFKMDGTQETFVLHQPAIGHLLYGRVHMLRDWEADYNINLPVDEAMKRCLNTESPFFDESNQSR